MLIAAVVFLLAPLAQGQAVPDAPSVHFRGVSLAEALQRLVEVSDISLVYTSELVSGKTAYCATSDAAQEALLACVLRGSGLDYVRSSTGAYVLIASAEAPPPRGDLAGRVVDAATGEALPHAHVLLADASAGTTTNLGGQFTLGGLLSGPHLVTVRYVGYEPARREVVVPPQGQERLVVALRPRTHALAPLVVDGLARRPASDTLGAATLADGGLTALRPSGTADLADAAARLPGVASLQPLADLRIQGGAGGEYLTLLDGAPVRNPVSLGRHLAAFSPLALDRLTVHRAGFGTAWSHLVGVVAAEHDVSGPDGVNAAMSADAVSANVQAQGRLPLPGGREAAGMVALRTSAWGVYQDPALSSLLAGWDAPDPTLLPRWAGYPLSTDAFGLHRSAPDVSFSDLHAAARFPLSAFHTLRASGYRARNQLGGEFAAFVPATSAAPEHLLLVRNRYDWTNWAGQARLDGLLNARASYEVQATASHHASGYGYGGGVGEAEAPDSM
ncbi:MAG: carboxypeptidase regulatory-like domain-containing protein, partial [Rubricoccaceae bacterium]|nr:carboxypeptidase regulatory-like domain-containing protein [Rubricoccaceae bacterium]